MMAFGGSFQRLDVKSTTRTIREMEQCVLCNSTARPGLEPRRKVLADPCVRICRVLEISRHRSLSDREIGKAYDYSFKH